MENKKNGLQTFSSGKRLPTGGQGWRWGHLGISPVPPLCLSGQGVSPCSSGLVPVSRLVLPHVRSPRCGLIEGGMGPKAEPGAQRGEAAPQGL